MRWRKKLARVLVLQRSFLSLWEWPRVECGGGRHPMWCFCTAWRRQKRGSWMYVYISSSSITLSRCCITMRVSFTISWLKLRHWSLSDANVLKCCKSCLLRSRFTTPCRSLSSVVGSVVCGRPCQPAVAGGAMYSSMAICAGCLVPFISHDQTVLIEQAHWAALASFIQSIAGDFLRVSDDNDLPQLTSAKCIKPSPFCWCQPPRTHVVREYRDYKGVVQPQATAVSCFLHVTLSESPSNELVTFFSIPQHLARYFPWWL